MGSIKVEPMSYQEWDPRVAAGGTGMGPSPCYCRWYKTRGWGALRRVRKGGLM